MEEEDKDRQEQPLKDDNDEGIVMDSSQKTEKDGKQDFSTYALPLFSEQTANFLINTQTPEEAHYFMEGDEYSMPYLSKKIIFAAWDKYCDNFSKLILPVLFFSVMEAMPIILFMLTSNPVAVIAFSVLVLAPLQISKNLFFIGILAGYPRPFRVSMDVFRFVRFYIRSIIIVCAFMICLFSGISLMILPGYVFYVMFFLSLFFAADEHASLKAAFKLSFVGTRGYRFFIGTIFLFTMMIQSLTPGIFAIEIADKTIKAGLALGIWNIAGFSIFTLVIAPIIQIINTELYYEAKRSIFKAIKRAADRMGGQADIMIRRVPEEYKEKNQAEEDSGKED